MLILSLALIPEINFDEKKEGAIRADEAAKALFLIKLRREVIFILFDEFFIFYPSRYIGNVIIISSKMSIIMILVMNNTIFSNEETLNSLSIAVL
jgi:hypothetical protein